MSMLERIPSNNVVLACFPRRRFLPVSIAALFPPESTWEEKTEVQSRTKVWLREILTPCSLPHPYQWRSRGPARCATSGVQGGGACSNYGPSAPPSRSSPPSSGRTAACSPGRRSALSPLRRPHRQHLGAEEWRGEAGTPGCRTAAGCPEPLLPPPPPLLPPPAGSSCPIA